MNQKGKYATGRIKVPKPLKPLQIFRELNKTISIYRNEIREPIIVSGTFNKSKTIIADENGVTIQKENEKPEVTMLNEGIIYIKGSNVGKFKITVIDNKNNNDSFNLEVKERLVFKIDEDPQTIKIENGEPIEISSNETTKVTIKSAGYNITLIEAESSNDNIVKPNNVTGRSFELEPKGEVSNDAAITIKYKDIPSLKELAFKFKVKLVEKSTEVLPTVDPPTVK